MIQNHLLEDIILPQIFKPGRYLGLEEGAYRKNFHQAQVTMALAFPELYEIGISNHAHKLFYSLVNQQPGFLCDRAYAPDKDFRESLMHHEIPLFGVETRMPLAAFDFLAFSLQYELNYTTLLGTLEAAQIPLRREDRQSGDYPLILAGGPGSTNPLPLAPFFDGFIIGDGEEILLEILEILRQAKKSSKTIRMNGPEILRQLAKLDGIYIDSVTERAYKRIVDIAETKIELAPLIPTVGAVHDRITVEARRGCDRMCRFCQPCFINLPVREQSIEAIKQSALSEIEKTGYEECSLLSLSIADYSYFKPLVLEVSDALREKNVSLSLPSQRADRFSLEVAQAVQNIRKSTLTFAPEAGTARLRDVINKNLSDDEIMNAVITSYRAGWNKVKLYFMIGLPTETERDLDGIVDLVRRMQSACAAIRREPGLSKKVSLEINLTLSNFVPKPHTPFQWFPQDSMVQLAQKRDYLRDKFRGVRGVKLNFTDPEISKLEGALSKGGREIADVIESAYRNGAYLDAWDDVLNFEKWFDAFKAHGIDIETYTGVRLTDPAEPLPWDCIDVGLTKSWLQEEYRRAIQAAATTPCFEACSTCGVCGTYSTWPKFMELPPGKLKKASSSPSPASTKKATALRHPPVCKVRFKIQKTGSLRFISHLDWVRMFHRVLSRAKIPIAYTQGFNPKPKTSFSPALPIFTESHGEYVDVSLVEEIKTVEDAENLVKSMNRHLPEGGKIIEAIQIPLVSPSIDKSILSLSYFARWTCNDPQKRYTIRERVVDLANLNFPPNSHTTLNQTQILDLAPYLAALKISDDDILTMQLCRYQKDSGEWAFIKPKLILDLIDSTVQWSLTRSRIELG